MGYFERALRIREQSKVDPTSVGEAQFALARALWETGRDRPRARTLALAARDGYATPDTRKARDNVDAWLATHRRP